MKLNLKLIGALFAVSMSVPMAGLANTPEESTKAAESVNARKVAQPNGAPETAALQDDNRDKLAEKPTVRVGGRLYARYSFHDRNQSSRNEFSIESARLSLSVRQGKRLGGKLSVDFAELLNEDEQPFRVLKDVWVKVAPVRIAKLKVGRFKRPFSRLALLSKNTLPVVSRGSAHGYLTGFLGYGGRDVGLMIYGRLWRRARLDYAVSLTNGSGDDFSEWGAKGMKDPTFRLEISPLKWLTVGGALSGKYIEAGDLQRFFDPADFVGVVDNDFPDYMSLDESGQRAGFAADHSWMKGMHWMGAMDVTAKTGRCLAMLEAKLGENYWYHYSPFGWSVTGMVRYRFNLGYKKKLRLEPAVQGEMLTIADDSLSWRSRLYNLFTGVNLLVGDHLRVMLQGKFVFNQGSEAYFDEKPYQGFWPGEWPGKFENSQTGLLQVAYAY